MEHINAILQDNDDQKLSESLERIRNIISHCTCTCQSCKHDFTPKIKLYKTCEECREIKKIKTKERRKVKREM
jgi:transposase